MYENVLVAVAHKFNQAYGHTDGANGAKLALAGHAAPPIWRASNHCFI